MNPHKSRLTASPACFPIHPGPVHDDASIEWWFIQGDFTDGQTSRSHFMFSLFRHMQGGAPSFSMLFRLEDSSQPSPCIISRVDEQAKEHLLRSRPDLEKTNLDHSLLRIYFEEIEKYGLPCTESATRSSACLDARHFSLSWDEFSLTDEEGVMVFRFSVPWADKQAKLVLRSRTREVDLNMLATPGARKMRYLTYPCCDLSGHYAGRAVHGHGWLDHQWGDFSWFVSEDAPSGPGRLLGWNWLGIRFDDGGAAVMLNHQDMETGKPLTSNFVMIGEDGAAQGMDDFTAEPLRFWQSPRTIISYPVKWRLILPSLYGELTFEPLGDDQEIPVAGATRAIWEGAGRITGKLGDRHVSGSARLELNGYGYVFHLSDVLDSFSHRISAHLELFFPRTPDASFFTKYTGLQPEPGNVEAIGEFLSDPMWDLLSRGGKYWRPMFGILMAEVLRLDSTQYEDLLSISTELGHLASLVIDDIEDGATTRRKGPCVHLLYGTDIAINAANTLYFLPMMKLREYHSISEAQRLAIYEKTTEFFVKAHFGQGLDISRKAATALAGNGNIASLIRDTLNIYELKSASPVEFITHTACIIAGANTAATCALVSFARSFGIAFQIKDDVHDFGSPGKWTKEPGADLACGKLTYVILLALDALEGADRLFLTRLLCKEIPPSADHIASGIRIVRASGALQKADAKVLEMLRDGWSLLCTAVPQTDARILLKVICEHLLKLDYDSFDITA